MTLFYEITLFERKKVILIFLTLQVNMHDVEYKIKDHDKHVRDDI